jgi:hypothetical protein
MNFDGAKPMERGAIGWPDSSKEIKLLARKLLTITRSLAAGPHSTQSLFARVVEGTFRRDYLTLYTIVYLAEQDQPGAPTGLGTICMDLCRRVLEDVVSLEYMLLKGKEPYAKKFQMQILIM